MKAHHKDNQVGPNYDFFFFIWLQDMVGNIGMMHVCFIRKGGGNNSGTHFFKVTIVFPFFFFSIDELYHNILMFIMTRLPDFINKQF